MPKHQHSLYIVALVILTLGFYAQHRAISDLRAAHDTEAAAARAIEMKLSQLQGESLANETRTTIFHSITNATSQIVLDGLRKLDSRVDTLESGGIPPDIRELFPPDDVPPVPPLSPEMLERLLRGSHQIDDPSKDSFAL